MNRPLDRNYARQVEDRRRGSVHENLANSVQLEPGLYVPPHFQRMIQQIHAHRHEWEGMRIVNRNVNSSLDVFPREELVW